MYFGFLEEAKENLYKAASLNPNNLDIRNSYELCVNKLKEARKKDKLTFGGMFDKGPLYEEKKNSAN